VSLTPASPGDATPARPARPPSGFATESAAGASFEHFVFGRACGREARKLRGRDIDVVGAAGERAAAFGEDPVEAIDDRGSHGGGPRRRFDFGAFAAFGNEDERRHWLDLAISAFVRAGAAGADRARLAAPPLGDEALRAERGRRQETRFLLPG
jgi:hypothetical protein